MKEPSYFDQRMKLLGVTKENNLVTVTNPEAEPPIQKVQEVKIFSEDSEGNIKILFYCIDGELIVYYTDTKNPKPRFYEQIRLKEPKGNFKYKLPSIPVGQKVGAVPFFHPLLVKMYLEGQKIHTLFLTEGAFKGWFCCENGILCIGMTSITHYAGPDGKIHRDIRLLIEKCEVENVGILWDGDCLEISDGDLSLKNDVSRRPFGFFNAAKAIRKLVKEIKFQDEEREAPKIHFLHINSPIFKLKPKGIDDLLICAKNESEEKFNAVVQNIHNLGSHKGFFFKMNISNNTKRLYEYFALHDVQKFYARHGDLISEKEFFFKGDLYYYNDASNELELIAPKWAKDLRWIGDEFFMERFIPGLYQQRRTLLKYKKETLNLLHGKHFHKYTKHFVSFCNIPNHFNYKQVIESNGYQFYNRYFPFAHIPKTGSFDKILGFIKHIFGEYNIQHGTKDFTVNSWELGLDYLQILLTNPTQILPVICLYSPENNTGKSTFGKLQTAIFTDNVIQIGNSDLQSDFNEQFVDKLLVICEETLLERKKDVEKIKAMSTSEQISVNPKNQKQYTIDMFCKFQFYSNNKRMIYVTKYDERFWIIKVNPAKSVNPDLLAEMKAEIPAFIHFLKNRKLASEKESRMHFHHSLIRTETFRESVEVNEPTAATDMREHLMEMFLQEDNPYADRIEMPLKEIREEFFTAATSASWIKEILEDYLEVDQLRNKEGNLKQKRGAYNKLVYDGELGDFKKQKVNWKGRPYVFYKKDFVKEDIEIEENYFASESPNTIADNLAANEADLPE